jgi:hypothetical protein
VGGNPDDPAAGQPGKLLILKLFPHIPGDKIPRGLHASFYTALNTELGYFALNAKLDGTEHIGEFHLALGVGPEWAQKDEDHVRGRVGHKLQVVGAVFVVRRDEQRHQRVQELLARFFVAEQRVAVYEVHLTFLWVWDALPQRHRRRGVQV